MTHPTIDLLDRDAASILLFEAVIAADTVSCGVMTELAQKYQGGKDVPIQCTVGGVEVDIVAALTEAWKRCGESMDTMVKEKALQMVADAGLADLAKLTDQIERLTSEYRYTVLEKFRKAGIDVKIPDGWEDW